MQSEPRRPEEIHNRGIGPGRESERPIVVKKRVTTVERRGLTGSIAAVRGKESRLEEIPITEEWLHIEALNKQVSGDGPATAGAHLDADCALITRRPAVDCASSAVRGFEPRFDKPSTQRRQDAEISAEKTNKVFSAWPLRLCVEKNLTAFLQVSLAFAGVN